MEKRRTTHTARQSAGNKRDGAAKRGAQPKAGSTGAKPAPKAERGARQKSKSKNVANVQSQQAARTPKPPKGETVTEVEKPQEKQSAIWRLVNTLKRVIGYKKGERNEFRYNYDEGHPGYVFKEKQGKLKSFGVTHSDSTFGIKNMPLEENPDSDDNLPAYIRNGVITSKKKRNSSRMKNMKLSPQDKARVKSKKRNYKKVAKQQNKKSK